MNPALVGIAWKRAMEAAGEEALITKPDGGEYPVRVRPLRDSVGSSVNDVAGGARATRRRFLVLFTDIEGSSTTPVEIKQGDRLVFNDRTMSVRSVDDTARRAQGQTFAIEIEVTGS